jgi:glycosyltransferase involved in cell wall biosynthesis
MKIAVIGHLKYDIKEPFAGGLEKFTYDLVKGLQKANHEVILFASANSDPSLNVYPVIDKATKLVDITDHEREQIEHKAYLKTINLIKNMNFDVVHNNSLNYLPINLSTSFACPLITTLHTPPFESLANAIKNEDANPNHSYYAVSETCAQSWSEIIKVNGVIHNGINLSEWNFNDKPDTNSAVWFGRITPDKGLEDAIRACYLAKRKLKVVGPICNREYYLDTIKPLLYLYADYVDYLGHLNIKDLNDVVSNSKVMVYSSKWQEPYGLVIAEALACGTPIAGYNSGAVRELVNKNSAVIVNYNHICSLAQAINKAAKLDRYDCRLRAYSELNLSKMISKYDDLYRNAAECYVTKHSINESDKKFRII